MKTYSKNNHRMCSIKKAKFIGKYLCLSFFFNTVARPRPATLGLQLYEKGALAKMFFCEFRDILKNTFFAEHLRVTASGIRMQVVVIYNINLSLQFVTINLHFLSCDFSRWRML